MTDSTDSNKTNLNTPDDVNSADFPPARLSPNKKGGKEVTRQNFSMHPELMRAVFSAAAQLSQERTQAIIDTRAKRITYSKVVAALVWLLKTRYLSDDGTGDEMGDNLIGDDFRKLIAEYEASEFERPDDTPQAEAIMVSRRQYAASLPGAVFRGDSAQNSAVRDEATKESNPPDE